MSTPLPQLGSVVWAELADSNGIRKIRPAVVVTATADIAAGRTVRLLAITTCYPMTMCYSRGTGKARLARGCGANVQPSPVGRRRSRSLR
jgi:hypothetical protein